MKVSIVAWAGEGTNECGHDHGPGDLCYVICPVVGMVGFTTACEACGKTYTRGLQRLARMPLATRRAVAQRAQAAAEATRTEGMLAAARAWLVLAGETT